MSLIERWKHTQAFAQAEIQTHFKMLSLSQGDNLNRNSFDWPSFLEVLEKELSICVENTNDLRIRMYDQGRLGYLAGIFLAAAKEWLDSNGKLDDIRFDFDFDQKLETLVNNTARAYREDWNRNLYQLYMWHLAKSISEPDWGTVDTEQWIQTVKVGEMDSSSLTGWNANLIRVSRDYLSGSDAELDPFWSIARRLKGEGFWQMRFSCESPD